MDDSLLVGANWRTLPSGVNGDYSIENGVFADRFGSDDQQVSAFLALIDCVKGKGDVDCLFQ